MRATGTVVSTAARGGLRIDSLWPDQHDTPGNVGVAISGGGSRALVAGMGQLRGLRQLRVNGTSVLSQMKALAGTSGGTWVTVPFCYLPTDVSDDDYLNRFVADPHDPDRSGGTTPAAALDYLPEKNAAISLTHDMRMDELATQLLLLHLVHHVPPTDVWQTAMALRFLAPYGLFEFENGRAVPSYFTLDQATRDALLALPAQDPALADMRWHPLSLRDDGERRPFMICNTAMFVVDEASKLDDSDLAPFQCTPVFSGIVGTPDATDIAGRPIGGGGVTSAVSAGALTATGVGGQTNLVGIDLNRPVSLADILGTSSASYALSSAEALGSLLAGKMSWKAVKSELEALILSFTVPEYQYFVPGTQPVPHTIPNRFADGGNLEDTGIPSLLAYQDIDSVVAFVNCQTPMSLAGRRE